MAREYKAFISYRHLPLEIDVAKRLHRRIEHFVIPKQLRRNGEKKLGLVFRDQDELPISSNLSENIRTALDSSEYLIVICTPETSKSQWVLREISYFLENHDRDHVLAVLADGTPETAFPSLLTEVRSSDGDVLQRIEPLAANITADTAARRNALLRTESLRILATLIGCPYDALYRREQRYRRRRIIAAASVVLTVAAAFIGMLLDRNAQIRNQLRLAQERESVVLAQLAQSEYKKGNYRGAVTYAFQATPSENGERPYVGEAEWQLGQILMPYQLDGMAYDQSIEQDTDIERIALSDDAALAFTVDEFGSVRCFDVYSGSLMWERQLGSSDKMTSFGLFPISRPDALLFWENYGFGAGLFDAQSGETLWESKKERILAVDRERGVFLSEKDNETDKGISVLLRRLEDAELLQSFPVTDDSVSNAMSGALSPSGRYAAVIPIQYYSDDGTESLLILDLENGTQREIDRMPYSFGTDSRLAFTESDLLLAAYDSWNEGGETRCYDPKQDWQRRWTTNTRSADNYVEYVNGKIIMSGQIDVLEGREDGVLVGGLFALTKLDEESGSVLWRKTFKNPLIAFSPLEGGLSCVMLENGTFSSMSAGGNLGAEVMVNFFSAEFPVKCGALAGNTFDDTVAALVSADYPGRASIVRRRDSSSAAPLEQSRELSNYPSVETSPSGERLAAAEYDFDNKCVVGEFWDLKKMEKIRSFSVPSDISRFSGGFAVTEDGVLIADGCALNTEEEILYSLDGKEEIPDRYEVNSLSVRDSGNGRILSAVISRAEKNGGFPLLLWENGRTLLAETRVCPDQERRFEYARLLAVGGNGCVLVEAYNWGQEADAWHGLYQADNDRWIELPDLQRQCCALGEKEQVLAAMSKDGKLALYDSSTGERLREILLPLPALSVEKLFFTDEDRELLLFTSSGTLAAFDVKNGQLLHRSSFSQYGMKFVEDVRYDTFVSEKGNHLVIVYDNPSYTEASMFILDRENWECIGDYGGAFCYVPAVDQVLLRIENEGVYCEPLLDLTDLRRIALEYLERKPLR